MKTNRNPARTLRRWSAAAALAALTACGGGGGGDSEPTFSTAPAGPPATAATVGLTSTDAIDATKAVIAAADGMVAAKGSVSGLAALTGVAVSGGAAAPSFAFVPAGRKQALAVTTETCDTFIDPPCSGTVRVDTDVPDNATVVRRGQYLDATFNAVSGSVATVPVTLAGGLRVEFLTDFNVNANSVAGLGMRLKFTGFSGTAAGNAFGPLSQTADLSFSAQSVPTLVLAGARYGQLSGVTINGAGSYLIQPGTARVGYGSAAAGYVDVGLGIWRVVDGRPAASSSATVDAPGWNIFINVDGTTASTVVYLVSITGAVPGQSAQYLVTAQYPPGGGAPSYTAAPVN